MTDLTNRTAAVTGGASGIGRATAILLAEHGARVCVGDLRLRKENDQEFSRLGIEQMVCDVQREADVAALVDRASGETGRLDILVNNAGIGMVGPITEVSEEQWNACLGTNLTGAFFGCKHAIARMQSRGGSIINIASNAGILPRAHDPVYSISKAALVALTKSLALCHGVEGIRVNAVCPGPVGRTRMVDDELAAAGDPDAARQNLIDASPLAAANCRMIAPEEIARAVLYLASDAAAMVTGTLIAIDGGKSLGVPPPKRGEKSSERVT